MNHRHRCPPRESIATLVMEDLPAAEAADLRAHLQSCDACRRYHDEILAGEQDLRAAFEQVGRFSQKWHEKGSGTDSLRESTAARRRLPLGPAFIRMAIAAVLVAGLAGLFAYWRPDVPPLAEQAHADYVAMLREISRTKSVSYAKLIDIEGHGSMTMYQTVLRGGLMRSVWDTGGIVIDDYAEGLQLQLNPERKRAYLSRMVHDERSRLMNYADWIGSLHNRKAVYSGQEELDGRIVDVYQADKPYEKWTVWVDPQRNLPVRVRKVKLPYTDRDIRPPTLRMYAPEDFGYTEEDLGPAVHIGYGISAGRSGLMGQKSTIIWTDLKWNVDVDPSQFQIEVPPDYIVVDEIDFGDWVPSPEALVETLRFWAEMSDGRFPENVNALGDATPKIVAKYKGTASPKEVMQRAHETLGLVVNGMAFAQTLRIEDNWYYAGRTVRLGEGDKPLAWWFEEDTNTWRVIYGDLHMADLPADQPPPEPPAAPASQPANP